MADPFAVLFPAGIDALPVAWHHLQVPGPPAAFALTAAERSAPTPLQRMGRRLVRLWDGLSPDRLALVDKALPHARFDLMLSEVSATDKPDPTAVATVTGQALWRIGRDFVAFVSDPTVQRGFGLAGGRLQLALNCDPHTQDRESVQAAKQFHLHLLYWCADELAPLSRPVPLARETDPRLRRQCLDPLTFLGPLILERALDGLDLRLSDQCKARWLPADPAQVLTGRRPPGAWLALPGWQVLGWPGFEALVRRLHQSLSRLAADLLWAFTGARRPPPPWQRHTLLPMAEIGDRLRDLPWCEGPVADGLTHLAAALRPLPAARLQRLRQARPSARMHCLTLNQPAYALTLLAPLPNRPERPLNEAAEVLLGVHSRLFSGIGGAGLLPLGPGDRDGLVPSVRVLRGVGACEPVHWHRRADFQRAFALATTSAPTAGPVRRLRDFVTGWI